jgi:hypothetical protein
VRRDRPIILGRLIVLGRNRFGSTDARGGQAKKYSVTLSRVSLAGHDQREAAACLTQAAPVGDHEKPGLVHPQPVEPDARSSAAGLFVANLSDEPLRRTASTAKSCRPRSASLAEARRLQNGSGTFQPVGTLFYALTSKFHASREGMFSWFPTDGERKAIRQDRRNIVGRARRFLLSYLAATMRRSSSTMS